MKIFGKAVLACGTAAILAVTPMSAMATNIDRHTAASGSNDVMHQAWDGHHRRWRHHDRIDGGDILTGIGILAGIAIIAGAASDADKRDRDEPRYDDRNDDRRDDRPIGQSAYQDNDLGTAVSACTDAAERSAGNGARVSEIRSVTRDGNGWRVEGDLSQDSFTCAATDGRVDYIRINDREI